MKSFVRASQVRPLMHAFFAAPYRDTEEFSIYMHYVRKLGFEETPDYDFLRELFSKVMKTLGEPEDGVYDWMLLNGGKGWEAGHVRVFGFHILDSI